MSFTSRYLFSHENRMMIWKRLIKAGVPYESLRQMEVELAGNNQAIVKCNGTTLIEPLGDFPSQETIGKLLVLVN
jgi:hypothetical protein